MGNFAEICKDNNYSDTIISIKLSFNKNNQYEKTTLLNSSSNNYDSSNIHNSIISNNGININNLYLLKNKKKTIFKNNNYKYELEKNNSLESSLNKSNNNEYKTFFDENNQKENSKNFHGPIISHLILHSKHRKKNLIK